MSSDAEDDLYRTLTVASNATSAQITKAYRLLALRWHPDKNRGNAAAADVFVKIQKAYEVLHDEKARQAYDGVYKLRLARKEREAGLGAKQKKMKQDLLERERQTQIEREREYTAKRKFEAEVERLRKEGYKRQRTDLATNFESKKSAVTEQDVNSTLKIRWKSKHGAVSGAYLKLLFSQFGAVNDVVVLSKGNSAMVCFDNAGSADAALLQKEILDPPRVFKISALKGKTEETKPPGDNRTGKEKEEEEIPPISDDTDTAPSVAEYRNYESVTMARLRQAAERQKLREQILAEDD